MNILFRVDAGGPIGLGHFYRSLSLARVLRGRGHHLWFCHLDSAFWKGEGGRALAETEPELAETSRDAFDAGRYPPVKQFALSEEKAGEEMLKLLSSLDVDLLYVDGNQEFSSELADSIKRRAKLVFYQNLGASRQLADLFILPSIHQGPEFFKDFNAHTRIAKGLDYVVLHPDLAVLRPKSRHRTTWNSLALSAGGSDPNNTLLRFCSLLRSIAGLPPKLLFFYGKDYLHLGDIPTDLPDGWEFRPYLHKEILQQDVLLTAFGVSTYEFLYLGMPLLAYGHQESTARAAAFLAEQSRSFVNLGNLDKLELARLQEAVQRIGQPDLRRELSQKARKLLDLRGPERIADLLEELYNSSLS